MQAATPRGLDWILPPCYFAFATNKGMERAGTVSETNSRQESPPESRKSYWLKRGVLAAFFVPSCILAALLFARTSGAPEPHKNIGLEDEVIFERPEAGGQADEVALKIRSVGHYSGELIYDVVYTQNGLGMRMTPTAAPQKRERFLAFFGGSYTYGHGVEDDETLPYYTGQLAPDFVPYNFAQRGDGPQQMLDWIREGSLPDLIQERNGYGIYVYMPYHLERLVGAMPSFNLWTAEFPHYRLDETGGLIRDGTFRTGRPLRSLLYDALWEWPVLRSLKIRLPLRRYPKKDLDLLVAVIAAARDSFQRQFSASRFAVLIYCFPDQPPARWNGYIAEQLQTQGIAAIDACAWLGETDIPTYRLPDFHPKPAMHRRVAQVLVQELGIGATACAPVRHAASVPP